MQFPAIDPVAFSIGSLQLRWYGLMYLLAFFVGWGLARWRASRPGSGWKTVDVDDLLTFVMLGVILGARLGYVLFYDLPAYIDDPGEILRIWKETGMTAIMVTHDVDEAVYLSDKVVVMTPRPGRITGTLDIQLSRPRARSSEDFLQYRGEILRRLHYGGKVEEPNYYI